MLTLQKQNSQSGQATVEYVLLLAIAVALILGLANQLIKPFGNWAQDYMGQYLECLIDMGELPTVGGSGTSGVCNSKFSSFSVANGRPQAGSGSGSGSGSSQSQSARAPSGDDRDAQADAKEKIRDRSDGSGSGSGASSDSGGSSRIRGAKGFPIGGRGGADGPNNGNGGNEIVEKLPESKFLKTKNSGNSTSFAVPSSSKSESYQTIPLRKAKGRTQVNSESSKLKAQESMEMNEKGKKFVVKPTERKIAKEQEEANWSFSHYMKYAVILAIIIAIVLFIGGQVMQISKSMEK